jgi:hypothetical protein
MKSRTLLLVLAACLVIGALVLILARRPDKAGDATPPAAKASGKKETKAGNAPPSSGSNVETARAKEAAPLDNQQRETILAEIEQLSVSYDAKELPKIEPYLLHPDAGVRKAAMDGMIVLGDSAAAPLLRKAAEKAPTPQEAVALTEAADFMELPEGSFIPKERTKEGTRVPMKEKPARGR